MTNPPQGPWGPPSSHDYTLRHNQYSQHGCIGCAVCEGGPKKVARTAVLWCTLGLAALAFPFFKKCQYCGHNMFMSKHNGPDGR